MSDVRDQDLNDLLSQNPVFYTTQQENDVETCMKMLIHDERCPVAGANVCGLISTLCHTENGPASLFTQIFLRNFRTFCSPRNCLRSIIQKYEMAEDNAHRERILSILVVWVRDYWDMVQDSPILNDFLDFSRRTSLTYQSKSVQELEFTSNWLLRSRHLPTSPQVYDITQHTLRTQGSSVPPLSIVSRSLLNALKNSSSIWEVPILEFDPLELARQITLCENTLFCAIDPFEPMYPVETDVPGSFCPQYIRKMTKMSTQLTSWISQCILRETNLKQRTLVLRFFILFAEASYKLQNFNLLMEILGALGSSNLHRLKKTWKGLPPRKIAKFEFLSQLMDPARNFNAYRTCLHNAQGPTLPFLGLILTDITFAKEGNPVQRVFPGLDFPLVNLARFYQLKQILRDFQKFQKPYSISPVPEIQTFIRGIYEDGRHRTPSEYFAENEQFYYRSLELEPRMAAPMNVPASPRSPGSRMFVRTLTALRNSSETLSLSANNRSDSRSR